MSFSLRPSAFFLSKFFVGLFVFVTLCANFTSVRADEAEKPADPKAAARAPKRYAIIYNMGYAGDHLPKEPEQFEKFVKTLKSANFNTVWGIWDPKRAEICKKYDMQLFVDLLAPEHHVYKSLDQTKAICESLRDNPTVYGYHLWSDVIGKTSAGRTRDVKNVRSWDDTHAVYVGTYKMSGMGGVEGEDIFGYYDFHWKRGGLWSHLNQAFNRVKSRRIPFLEYADAAPGLVGKGNVNRIGFTLSTATVLGMRGYTYHYPGNGIISKDFEKLDALGEDLAVANGKIAASGAEIMQIGLPTAAFSTTVTMSENDRPVEPAAIPGGLPAIPEDSWFKVTSGEVLISTCRDAAKRDVLCFASHNAYKSQDVTLKLTGKAENLELFDRESGKWKPLAAKDGAVSFKCEAGAVELLRLNR